MKSASPARIIRAASITAVSPERHSLLMVTVGTSQPMPAARLACRAGPWPAPAWMTCPTITAWTCSGATPVASSAWRMAWAPSSLEDSPARLPRNRPNGVRAPPRMTGVRSAGPPAVLGTDQPWRRCPWWCLSVVPLLPACHGWQVPACS